METTLTLPTIHMNGTSRKELHDAYLNAHHKTQDALEAVRRTFPHGRDYYVQSPDAGRQATIEHLARLDRLAAVLAELETLAHHTMGA